MVTVTAVSQADNITQGSAHRDDQDPLAVTYAASSIKRHSARPRKSMAHVARSASRHSLMSIFDAGIFVAAARYSATV